MNLILAAALLLSIGDSHHEFTALTYTNAKGESMRYLIFVPPDQKKPLPLVVWLHGGGSRGDLAKIVRFGDGYGPRFFVRAEVREKYPAIVIAPLCPEGVWWSDADAKEPTREMRLVLEIVDSVSKRHSVDRGRIYPAGMSMGGFAVFDLLARYPKKFAAGIPICGGGDVTAAPVLAKTPLWVFHGEADEAVSVQQSRRMVKAIREAGGKPRYTEYPGVDHRSWIPAFQEPDLLPWLFAQKRKK